MKSFFDKLTATEEIEEEEESTEMRDTGFENPESFEEETPDGELAIDIFDKGDVIILKTMIAGVKPEDLEISISRDSVTIRGTRHEEPGINKESYHTQELYWGSFSRKIQLPTEIDIDNSSAVEKHGLLSLELPKVDKERKTTLNLK